ncbi:MAG: phage major capsid protein [Actinomycetota bacterium]|nr:phage major capsid protein [Actinomycetota bacterium]
MLTPQELLRKSILTVGNGEGSGDFGGPNQATLSIEQARTFIQLMTAGQSIVNDVRRVDSSAAKWTESKLDFAGRITRPGVEANRLDYTQRAKVITGVVEIDTDLLRAEVPISDEVFEDNVGGDSIRQPIETLIADRVGYDVEELFVQGDEDSTDPYLALQDGWLKRARNGGQTVDASTFDSGRDYQAVFKALLKAIPQRFLRNLRTQGAYYVPLRLEIEWRDVLAGRGTALGDIMLTSDNALKYQGIKIVGAGTFEPEDDTNASILLTNANNLYAGYHRGIKFETFRDPREGYMSYVVSARVGGNIAVPEACAIADGVDISDEA